MANFLATFEPFWGLHKHFFSVYDPKCYTSLESLGTECSLEVLIMIVCTLIWALDFWEHHETEPCTIAETCTWCEGAHKLLMEASNNLFFLQIIQNLTQNPKLGTREPEKHRKP